MSTSTFVAIQSEGAQWGLYAKIVKTIVSETEWDGAPPVELSTALGVRGAGRGAQSVLVIALGRDTVPFRSFGRLSFRQIDVSAVWAVPPFVRSPAARQIVSGVVLSDDAPPLVVVDTVALLAAAQGATRE